MKTLTKTLNINPKCIFRFLVIYRKIVCLSAGSLRANPGIGGRAVALLGTQTAV